jgi:hypothetical protein
VYCSLYRHYKNCKGLLLPDTQNIILSQNDNVKTIPNLYDIIIELKQNDIKLRQDVQFLTSEIVDLKNIIKLLINNMSLNINFEEAQDETLEEAQDETLEEAQDETLEEDQDETLEENQDKTFEEDQDETFEEDQDETFEEDQDETIEEDQDKTFEEDLYNHAVNSTIKESKKEVYKIVCFPKKISEFLEDWLIHQTYSNHIPFNILFNNRIDYSDYFNKNKLGIPHFVATSFVTEIHKLEYEKRPIHFLKDQIAVCNYECKDNAWKYHPYTSQTLCNIIKELIISIKKYTIDYMNFNKISLEFDNIDDKTNNDIDDKTFMRRVVNYNISPGIVLGKITKIFNIPLLIQFFKI